MIRRILINIIPHFVVSSGKKYLSPRTPQLEVRQLLGPPKKQCIPAMDIPVSCVLWCRFKRKTIIYTKSGCRLDNFVEA